MSDERTLSEHERTTLRLALDLPPGATPFPWQERLLLHFLGGRIPPALDIPTGLGKTAVMAVWLVARGLATEEMAAALPRRLVYVVDRRAVVDQATRVAMRLRDWVEGDVRMKEALGLDGVSLPISTLRGQFADNREWLEHPARPAIVVGTVDMVGSRLLFEGYGVSRKMRPIHAGYLGHDCLFVLDEAHLVPPFEGLLLDVTFHAPELELTGTFDECARVLPRARLLSLSATGRGSVHGAQDAEPLRLDGQDFEHPVVAKRIDARKSLRLEPLAGAKALPGALAERAWRLSGEGRDPVRILVFSNSRDDAEAAKVALERLALRALGKPKRGEEQAFESALFVGGRRVYEREQAAAALDEQGFLAGRTISRDRPAFLFATSAAEVGVDLDADHMVCDLVEFERMVQRLGRVNRRGDRPAEVCVFYDPKADDEEDSGARRLAVEQLERHEDGSYDASPGSIARLQDRARSDDDLRALVVRASSRSPPRPRVDRPLLDAWSMTSLREHTGRPEVAPWLRGWTEDEPQTNVVWRRYFPKERSDLDDFLEAAPPHLLEKLERPSHQVAAWLLIRHAELSKGALPEITPNAPLALVLGRALDVQHVWTLRDLPDDKKRLERALRGGTLVVRAELAGLSPDGMLDARHAEPPPTPEDDGWFGAGTDRPRVPFRIHEEDADATKGDNGTGWRERYRATLKTTDAGEVSRWLVVDKWYADPATEEDRSMSSREQSLVEHQTWAEERARRIADALGLPPRYAAVLTLAARLHDEGKRASRWQRAFNARSDGGPYAKTKGPVNVRLLDGYRHELGSLRYVERDEAFRALPDDDKDLVLHMIAAHHGFARPVISTSGFDDLPPSAVEGRAREVALRFLRMQEAWGPWGLAWWESLLRSADQWASRDNDRGEAR